MGRIIMSGFIPKLITPSSDSTVTGIPVTITGTGQQGGCSATINGIEYYDAINNAINIASGNKITFTIFGGTRTDGTASGYVSINGTNVLTASQTETKTYEWTVPNNITSINIKLAGAASTGGKITVTTT